VRLKLSIEPHDLEVKKNKIREFLQKGHKTKITLVLRGREMAFLNRAYEFLKELERSLGEDIKREKDIERMGNRISVLLSLRQ
jgi:translation initiation factor IF-3